MRKLVLFNMVTLDGFFESGPNGIEWHNVDEEFNDFAVEHLETIGTIIFGRVTYEGMASYWPTSEAIQSDPAVAGLMNSMPKIVFSRTLQSADWNNTRLLRDINDIVELKAQSGKDLVIFGSANLGQSFTRAGLIDEYRLIVNPVVIGSGRPLFDSTRLNLKMVEVRPFKSGNILLTYQPA